MERVIGYYNNILKVFPTIEALANTSYEEFFPYYQGLGYYSRARNMLKTAKIITEEYQGIFPNNTDELKKLPGVGPYTAAAIRAFVYNEKVLSFDTNLEKIFSRFYHGSRFQKLSKEEKTLIEKDFQGTGISGREINAAFMDFGSLVSFNIKPSDESGWEKISKNYPLDDCFWLKTQGVLEVQEKKKKRVFPTKDASIKVVLHENHRIYYSSVEGDYQPFILPPTEDNVRQRVQEYFRDSYNLEVSVRPIHDKYFENDRPFIICNAQVQKGLPSFRKYQKENGFFVKIL
ncbi:hypothetical protein AUJ87_02855 [Candidatus Gracilibacteria bacterium CG1_02_38_174]|nr:MAG: hypothetical protein AUJ87_02855 [Candidatus Gracilibacteria bacterium CG1_02_38_174]